MVCGKFSVSNEIFVIITILWGKPIPLEIYPAYNHAFWSYADRLVTPGERFIITNWKKGGKEWAFGSGFWEIRY